MPGLLVIFQIKAQKLALFWR